MATVLHYYWRDYLKVRDKELRVSEHRLEHLTKYFGETPVLMPIDIERFLKPYRLPSRNRYRTLLRAVLLWGQGMGYVSGDIPLKLFKKEKEKGARTRRMLPDEETRLRAVMGQDLSDLFTAAVDTGLRYGTLRQLKVGDIREGLLDVKAASQKHGQSVLIPLTDRLRQIVGRRSIARKSADRLFEVNGFRHQWDDARRKAKVDGFHWHDLRGEFASRLAEAGVEVHMISAMLGHSSLDMTLRYLRPRVSSFGEAIRKLGV